MKKIFAESETQGNNNISKQKDSNLIYSSIPGKHAYCHDPMHVFFPRHRFKSLGKKPPFHSPAKGVKDVSTPVTISPGSTFKSRRHFHCQAITRYDSPAPATNLLQPRPSPIRPFAKL